MISKSCLDFDSAKGNWVCLSEHAMKRWETDDLMIEYLLSKFEKYASHFEDDVEGRCRSLLLD